MKSYSQLRKEAAKAPKFILVTFVDGRYVFVADREKTGIHDLTENVNNALLFSEGFDDKSIKEKAWTISTGYDFLAIPA